MGALKVSKAFLPDSTAARRIGRGCQAKIKGTQCDINCSFMFYLLMY